MSIVRVISMIFGVFCIIVFVPPLIMYKILNIGNATGLFVGAVLIIYGIFAVSINHHLIRLWHSIPGRVLVGIVGTVVIFAIIIAIIISIMMFNAAGRKPSGGETLIVLGCQVKGTKPSLMLMERLNAAKRYLDEHDQTVCILSGGKGDDEGISEAECMYNYLTENGISSDRLILEDMSTSTRENFQYSLNIIEQERLSKKVAIVTNEFHEYRAFKIAEKLDVEPSAVPASTHWWLFFTYFVREWYGVVYEWTGMGK